MMTRMIILINVSWIAYYYTYAIKLASSFWVAEQYGNSNALIHAVLQGDVLQGSICQTTTEVLCWKCTVTSQSPPNSHRSIVHV